MTVKPYNITSLSSDQDIARLDNLLTMLFSQQVPMSFYDRGDVTSVDFTSIPSDGTYHVLDLSSIVPDGAKAVALLIELRTSTVGCWMEFRKNGNSNENNRSTAYTQVANQLISWDIIVPCDGNRKIQAGATNITWNIQNITVKGWWK